MKPQKTKNQVSANASISSDVIGEDTNLPDAKLTIASGNLRGESYELPLNDLIGGMVKSMGIQDPTGNLIRGTTDEEKRVPSLPSLVNRDGVLVNDEDASNPESRTIGQVVKDNPFGYDPLRTQQKFFASQIDFHFLQLVFGESNLGEIMELPSTNSSEVNFIIRLPNHIDQYSMAMQYGDHKPIFLFSSFYNSYQCGEVAKDMSNGTNLGWQILDGDWVKDAFNVYDKGPKEGEVVATPYGYDKFDRERFLIDHSSAVLIGSYANLHYTRLGISLKFHKTQGFIHDIIVSGMYEKASYPMFLEGLLMLLDDTKRMRDIGNDVIATIDKNLDEQTNALGGNLTAEEVQECYKGIFEFTFKDQLGEGVDPASVRAEDGGNAMFIADREEQSAEGGEPEKQEKE